MIIVPMSGILSSVPQYLQRLALALTIFLQLRHLISFTFLFFIGAVIFPACRPADRAVRFHR